jgi:hypothetical protein
LNRAVIIAVIPIRMMQVVRSTLVALAALRGVLRVDVESVLIDMAFMQRVEVSVVQVVGVAVVDDCGMSAILSVLMWMVSVNLVLI